VLYVHCSALSVCCAGEQPGQEEGSAEKLNVESEQSERQDLLTTQVRDKPVSTNVLAHIAAVSRDVSCLGSSWTACCQGRQLNDERSGPDVSLCE
jgi:hypothetical protein